MLQKIRINDTFYWAIGCFSVKSRVRLWVKSKKNYDSTTPDRGKHFPHPCRAKTSSHRGGIISEIRPPETYPRLDSRVTQSPDMTPDTTITGTVRLPSQTAGHRHSPSSNKTALLRLVCTLEKPLETAREYSRRRSTTRQHRTHVIQVCEKKGKEKTRAKERERRRYRETRVCERDGGDAHFGALWKGPRAPGGRKSRAPYELLQTNEPWYVLFLVGSTAHQEMNLCCFSMGCFLCPLS